MNDSEKIRITLAKAEDWRRKWIEGRLNDVQPAVVLDDVLWYLEHDDS
jgi:hypothetical protein